MNSRKSSMKHKDKRQSSRAGFTIVEMLVVIGITTLLSATAITYSKIGQREVALSVETSKIAELILQARELAVATYAGPNNSCAYGVHFDFDNQPYTYSLFAYAINGSAHCPTIASTTETGLNDSVIQEYSAGSWQIPFAEGVTAIGITENNHPTDILTDVLFYPPAPTTLMSRDDINGAGSFMSPADTSKIYLETTDGKNSSTISVSPEGQVTL